MNDLTNKPGFRVGRAGCPRDDDPWFDNTAEAEQRALQQLDDGVLAVWDGPSGDTLALVFEGTVFRP